MMLRWKIRKNTIVGTAAIADAAKRATSSTHFLHHWRRPSFSLPHHDLDTNPPYPPSPLPTPLPFSSGRYAPPPRPPPPSPLSVPADVSVIGYDDSGWLNCTDPPLTTVRQPIEPMGKAAVALLVNQMETLVAHPEELLFEPELVVRGSTGPAAVRPQARVTAIS